MHQGETFLVERLDLDEQLALVRPADPDWTTDARTLTDVRLLGTTAQQDWGPISVCFGTVEVTTQVVSFPRRRLRTGEVLGEEPLDLPPRTLRTTAVWWTTSAEVLAAAGVAAADLPGALHASIGLLPLVATCDRWDVGGVSIALHPDTGQPTVVVHDGHPGGAGFSERGFTVARTWWRATLDAVTSCGCTHGCLSCVQSPKCGDGNDPLDKAGAERVLRLLLGCAPQQDGDPAPR